VWGLVWVRVRREGFGIGSASAKKGEFWRGSRNGACDVCGISNVWMRRDLVRGCGLSLMMKTLLVEIMPERRLRPSCSAPTSRVVAVEETANAQRR
jgi:hypothetical protein